MAQFTLSITLGNAGMLTGEHVAEALNRVADRLWQDDQVLTRENGMVFDINGNRVGDWSVS